MIFLSSCSATQSQRYNTDKNLLKVYRKMNFKSVNFKSGEGKWQVCIVGIRNSTKCGLPTTTTIPKLKHREQLNFG